MNELFVVSLFVGALRRVCYFRMAQWLRHVDLMLDWVGALLVNGVKTIHSVRSTECTFPWMNKVKL